MIISLPGSELKKLVKSAKDVIDGTNYIVLATVDGQGNPWNSPLNCAYDGELNFYWKSPVDSQHSKNIRLNNKAFFVIFDSRAPIGDGVGIYFEGKAYEINEDNVDEVQKGCDLIGKRIGRLGSLASKFIGSSPRRLYKAVPERVWINAIRIVGVHALDGRVEVDLKSLKA